MGLCQAIARMEGFYAQSMTPNRPQRNHNPGDMEYGPFAQAHGAIASDGRFAVFPDDETGFEALRALLLTSGYRSLSIEAAIARFAPPSENNTEIYVQSVCRWTNRAADKLVGDCL
jgi:hypothetical protein